MIILKAQYKEQSFEIEMFLKQLIGEKDNILDFREILGLRRASLAF
jgi:hypothetical protein